MISFLDKKLSILIIFIISSCSLLEEASLPRYVLSVSGDAFFGKDEAVYDQEFIDQFPYTAINAQLNDGQNALMVLAYVRDNIFEFVSSDGIKLFVYKGFLVKTEGLANDIKRNPAPNYFSDILNYNNIGKQFQLSGTIDFTNPSAYELALLSSINIEQTKFKFNGELVSGYIVVETNKLPQIKRTFKNRYWILDNRIVKSEYNFPMNPKINLYEVKR